MVKIKIPLKHLGAGIGLCRIRILHSWNVAGLWRKGKERKEPQGTVEQNHYGESMYLGAHRDYRHLCGQSVYGCSRRASGLPEHRGYKGRGYCSVGCTADSLVFHKHDLASGKMAPPLCLQKISDCSKRTRIGEVVCRHRYGIAVTS